MLAKGDERAADDGQDVVQNTRWHMTGLRKRGSAARCSGRLVVDDTKAGAAEDGTGGAAGDAARCARQLAVQMVALNTHVQDRWWKRLTPQLFKR
eukprot:2963458-Pleurochrysis_carterae.AAC.1